MRDIVRDSKTGRILKTHGMSESRIYRIWIDMKRRCNDTRNRAFCRYGAKGIKVCKEWNDDFIAFYKWSMQNGYNNSLSIDRINNDMGYSPTNCRWTDRIVQSTNRSVTKFIDIDGEKYTIPQLSRLYGINKDTLYSRARRIGYTKDILILSKSKYITYFGKDYRLKDLAEKLGISASLLKYRIDNKWDIRDWGKPSKSSKGSV